MEKGEEVTSPLKEHIVAKEIEGGEKKNLSLVLADPKTDEVEKKKEERMGREVIR